MDREMENARVIGTFLSDNNKFKKLGTIATFEAVIQYAPANIIDTVTVQITTTGYYYGHIEIDDTDIININIVHTGFDIQYAQYTYDGKRNTLTIEGTAHPTKGGKPYTVTITPC